MNILVCIKTVPDVPHAEIDPETNNLIRDGLKMVINPSDLCGLKFALNIKEQVEEDVKISVLTMGPPSAEKDLRDSIAMGADEAYLLEGLEFVGSDTLATSYALSQAAKSIGDFDIVFTGDQTLDGDTGQVGPQLAEFLEMNQVTYVSKIDYVDGHFEVNRESRGGTETVKLNTPFVVTALKDSTGKPSKFALGRNELADTIEIHDLNVNNIDLDPEKIGQKGSRTWVKEVYAQEKSETGQIIDKGSLEENVDFVVELLKKEHVLV